jgi:hypothetical protein
MSEEKTLGQIAHEAYFSDKDFDWHSVRDYDSLKWERAAKAVALALESTDRRTTKCDDTRPRPTDTEDRGGLFTCHYWSSSLSVKVRE